MENRKIPVKNQEFTVQIEDFSKNGEGIGHAEGYTLFIKDAVPGDLVRARVTKAGKSFGYARIMEVIRPSEGRIDPPCPAARRCGGCQLMAADYPTQLVFKQKQVENALLRIGGLNVPVLPVIGAEHIVRYRNKAQYPVGSKNGHLIAGFYAQRTHEIIVNDDCFLSPREHRAILEILLRELEKAGIEAYDEMTGRGLVRHILIRQGFATGEIHVCIIINGKTMPHAAEIADKLMKMTFPAESGNLRVVGVSLNENTGRGNTILGERMIHVSGKETVADRIGEVHYEISPLSFYQVNPEQTKKLYDTVKEFAALTGTERVYDLYCGIGTIGLYLADQAHSLTGIEIVPRAVDDARKNAAANGFSNAQFFAGAAEEILPALLKKESGQSAVNLDEGNTVVIVDPPRKGCAQSLLDTLLTLKPDRIVYVSCDPATLARDLRILNDGGYQIGAVQPVDMFPQTVHIETVCCLYHQKNDFISVPYEPKDADYLQTAK